MIKKVWITAPPVIETKLATSQLRAKRIIAFIESLKYAPTTAQIMEKLGISAGQFHNAKPYLAGYKRVNLQWYPLDKVAEARVHHVEQRQYLTVAYNKVSYQNRLAREATLQ